MGNTFQGWPPDEEKLRVLSGFIRMAGLHPGISQP